MYKQSENIVKNKISFKTVLETILFFFMLNKPTVQGMKCIEFNYMYMYVYYIHKCFCETFITDITGIKNDKHKMRRDTCMTNFKTQCEQNCYYVLFFH